MTFSKRKKQILSLLFLFQLLVVTCLQHVPTVYVYAEEIQTDDVLWLVQSDNVEEGQSDNVEEGQSDNAEEGQSDNTEATQQDTQSVQAQGAATNALNLESPSAILMEASTGQVIYEKDADTRRSPASITKIMTLLLTFECLEKGTLKLNDEVVTSAYAKSMGGSQVFLDEGEIQTVDTLIKCIAVASGNDAAVAMAEKIAGSEEVFVQMMNEKAAQLGMKNTHFEDCCGLTASKNHYTTARDIAIMSQALITKYPAIYDYTTIWMEDIVHNTRQGSKTFTLSSTNKLLKQYEYTTGLKTGSTSIAKYCFSATARKNGIDLIAVVMAAENYKIRFAEAQKMLEYGFSVSQIVRDENKDVLQPVRVLGGKAEAVPIAYEGTFQYLDLTGADTSAIEKKIVVAESVDAPVEKGSKAGSAEYYLNGLKIGSVSLLYCEDVEKAVYADYFKKVLHKMLL